MTLTVELPDHLFRRIEALHPDVDASDVVMAAITRGVYEPTPSPLAVAAARAEADPNAYDDWDDWEVAAADGLEDDDQADAA